MPAGAGGGGGPIGAGLGAFPREGWSPQESPRSSNDFANGSAGGVPGVGGPGSDGNVSGATYSRQQAGFERRIAWLEEDVALLHRRFRDGREGGTADDEVNGLASRMEAELNAERAAREQLEARLAGMEEMLEAERRDREAQLQHFSGELGHTLRVLIQRIDEGHGAGSTPLLDRADPTEERLRTLIKRIDEGLYAGAAALQDTLSMAAANLEPRRPSEPPTPLGTDAGSLAAGASVASYSNLHRDRDGQACVYRPVPGHPPQVQYGAFDASAPTVHIVRPQAVTQPMSVPIAGGTPVASLRGLAEGDAVEAEGLIRDWDRLRQENLLLKERRAQLQGGQQPVQQPVQQPATTPLVQPRGAVRGGSVGVTSQMRMVQLQPAARQAPAAGVYPWAAASVAAQGAHLPVRRQ